VQRERFDRLLLEHLSAAMRFAIRLTGDPHSAEDLLHDAIVRATDACDRFEERSSFTTWLFRIIVNCFRDRLRRSGIERLESEISEGAPEISDAKSADPSEVMGEQELARLIAERVSSLPARQREVLVLISYQDLSVTETSEVLGISESAVRVNLFHARERLKKELAMYMDGICRGI